MATCPKCKNFYLGSECPVCRFDRLNRPEVYEKQEKEIEQYQSLIVSTTPGLDGYNITKYCGLVTGSTVVGTGWLSEVDASFSDLIGANSSAFSDKFEKVKTDALIKAKKNAIDLGAHALVGVRVSFQTFAGNMIAAIVSGTAVCIEPQ